MDKEGSLVVTKVLVLFIFVSTLVLGNTIYSGSYVWLPPLLTLLVILAVMLALNCWAASKGVEKAWKFAANWILPIQTAGVLRIPWGRDIDVAMLSTLGDATFYDAQVVGVDPVKIHLDSKPDTTVNVVALTYVMQRLGVETGMKVLLLLASSVLSDGGVIVTVDAKKHGEIGQRWRIGDITVTLKNQRVMGPNMWFSGPWKPGVISLYEVDQS